MKPFRDLRIQRKMLLMTLLICGAVLFVAIAALFTFQVLNFRSNFQRDLATLAAIIANNSTAALAFKDAQAADEVVQSLKAKPTMVSACLATANGTVLAQYGDPSAARELSQFPPAGEFRFADGHLLFTQLIELDGKQVGTLYLREDYRQTFLELLGFYGLVILGVLIVSVSLAAFLSGRLQRVITDPVLKLAETARIVGERKDYSVRAPVSGGRDELGRLTDSFNEMLGRIQSQDAALSLSQQKMEALIHSIDGIVWERHPETFQFTFVSRQVERLLGYTPEAWLAQPNFWPEKLHPDDVSKALQTCQDMVSRRQPYSLDYRLLAADGRTVWIRESGVVLVEHDRPVAVRGIFQDITGQRQAAAQLEKLNRQLVESSRHAGMAEVATGVLHNVGNVLNSINVSAALLRDSLNKCQIRNVVRAASLLREHLGDAAVFLTRDPKGQQLPGFLIKVSDHLATEQRAWQKELDGLSKNIEHINEIVAMQQNYSRLSGVIEVVDARELVEDTLRMNEAAFSRHAVTLVRDFQAVPPVGMDKHKVLQILINLVRNAKHAITASGRSERILTVVIRPGNPGFVRIQVRDNGVGVASENLTRIFQHGFTTKKDGHGYGLHSGANAAREMGGSLIAYSDGPGTGATFTLELPVAGADPGPPAKALRSEQLASNHET